MELHFTKTNRPVDSAIDQLMEITGHICCPELVREMILAALKADPEEAGEADLEHQQHAEGNAVYLQSVSTLPQQT